MRCLVTAGPSYEPLDEVRRLTNASTGKLGCGLARFLARRGHEVCLLLGELASCPPPDRLAKCESFSTSRDLAQRLAAHAGTSVDAVFHAAAVGDFQPVRVWERTADGSLVPRNERKLSTAAGSLLAELAPTPKLIRHLREHFPKAFLVGWKYEIDGPRAQALSRTRQQIRDNHLHASVVNGPAYGSGFALLQNPDLAWPCAQVEELYTRLAEAWESWSTTGKPPAS